MAEVAVAIIIDVAIALIAAYLAGRLADRQNKHLKDDKPTTIAQRGAYPDWFLGLRRLGCVFCWAGRRRIKKESAPGGKGSLFGGGAKIPIYYESGLHVVAPGLVDELRLIQQNGKVLFQGPITRLTYPSGSTIDLGKEGAFVVYWGDQPNLDAVVPPLDSNVDDWIGIESRWPLWFRIDWVQKRLGSGPNWPAMEYTVFKYCRFSDAMLPSTASYIPPTFTLDGPSLAIHGHVNGGEGNGYFKTYDGIGTVTTEEGVHYRAAQVKDNDQIELTGNAFPDGTYTVLYTQIVTVIVGVVEVQELHVYLKGGISGGNNAGTMQLYSRGNDDGLNPAHAIAELMFGTWPYGSGRSSAPFNLSSGGNSLDAAGVIFEAEGLRASLLGKGGESAESILAGVLQDCGLFITLNSATGLYDFLPIRATDPLDWVTISEDMLCGTLPEVESPQGELPQSSVIYSFSDRANQFRDMTISVTGDGQASYEQRQNSDNVQLLSCIDFPVAAIISERRCQESLSGGAIFKMTANRTVRELTPGQVVLVDGIDEPLRIVSVDIQGDSAEVKIEAISDFMGAKVNETNQIATGQPAGGAPSGEIAAPLQFDLFQVPASIAATTTVIIPQIRASAAVADTTINISGDDVSFYEKETVTSGQAGGITTSTMGAGDVTGPDFDELGPDIDTVQDLSGDSASFNAGRQILMIVSSLGTEICYLDAITSTGGLGWTCNNIVRAQQGTTALAHPAGAAVYIFDPDEVPSVQDVLVAPGNTVYIKMVPGGMTAAEITSKSIVLV